MKGEVVLMATVLAFCLAPIAEAVFGRAVYYNPPYTPSACYGGRNYGTHVAGVKGELWGRGSACGRRYRVRCLGPTFSFPNACTGRSVVVTVVDFCREPCNGNLNLSLDAFAAIANPKAGNIRIDYSPA
ncbi:PREDICTED: EG45-like domain containing protein 2 [Tarenaya hassleriana]|uniref:EG45-like domain containing protein 2 n=1 Tax=Tarenaya hassleriana TaxID=28532 RepID=UPI00053C19DD|nr:PREDICTED: EG45-like domain containing protein 2 [Tarenaya hassleriana]